MVGGHKKRCAVQNCGSTESHPNEIFHTFPRNPELLEAWLKNVNNSIIMNIPYQKLRYIYQVCGKHFEMEQYQTPDRKKLNRGAVPTLFERKSSASGKEDVLETENLQKMELYHTPERKSLGNDGAVSSESQSSRKIAEEVIEEDEPMEMEIDETVPNTPIIENKRNSDDFLALMKETTPTIATQTVSPPVTPTTTNPPSAVSSETPPVEAPAATINEPSSKETPAPSKPANSVDISEVDDDDIEIIGVTTGTTPKRPIIPKPMNKPKRHVIDDDDVVCIDDDPRPKKRNTRPNKPPPLKEFEIIDLVDTKKGSANTKCINYACKSGVDMFIAPTFCLTFYRVKSSIKKQEVCQACCDLALQHFDGLAQSLVNGDLLMKLDIPIRSDLVEIDDSDSEDEADEDISEGFDEANLDFLRETIDRCMEESMKRWKLEEHGNNSMIFLKEKGAHVKEKFLQVDTMLHKVRKKLDGIHHDLYAEFKVRYENLPPIDINDVFYPTPHAVVRPTVTAAAETESDADERRSPRKTKPISYVELDDPASSNSNSPALADPGDSDFNSTGIEAIEIPPVPADLPPKGPIQKAPLKVGEMYYAVRFLTMGSWIRVRLAQIINPGSIVNGQAITHTMYCVSMESKQQTKYPTNRLVSGKEIAYSFPSPVLLEVGTRVIAIFRETPSTGETKKLKKEAFYPGIIAEPCSYTNRFRYLLFFDDGYAQYVEHKYVHLIFESSKDVWEDMHIDSRPFIKKYLESYPERPMVKLRKDQTVRTEYNGKWWLTTVMNIDCSLVQMFFEASSRVEWIYRGSTRLNPMFKEELAASNRNNKSRIPRQFNETGPYVQYTREPLRMQRQQAQLPQLQAQQVGTVRSVARKSTTSRPIMPPNKVQTVPFLPIGNNSSNTNAHTPPPSKVVYFTPRAQANTKTLYVDHVCALKCKSYISYDVNKLKGYNPLSKPLLCGWNRITYKHKGKREINYKAPCGRFIRNMPELHKYLRTTQSEMTVDLFDFDFWVHCLAEFVLERNSTINKDMSGGLENVAIPVVNYVDNDINDFCNYSIKREPMEGVHLNLDPEFLCGCDCEDDCEDKTKCQCWQLTLQGLPFLTKTMSPEYIGYTYRRLPEPVITGIYECNSRCKCAKTCLNRVVQNPLQLKLQVFKTNNRGWGIRCLNDIPQGAFICIYAGSILTEQMANEGGKNYGDEYLAELDYIEVVEKMKEDYEDEAVEEDEAKSGSKSREESADEEEEKPENTRGNRKRSMEDDTDFLPSSHVPKGKDSSYKTRLRRRTAEENETRSRKRAAEGGDKSDEKSKPESNEKDKDKNKDDDDDCVTISDDEDVVFREPSSFNPKNESNLDDSRPPMYQSVREMFTEDECIYVMDAKVTGNIGRFLNHSCSPNVFVQNVFVDTHDVRFPWVAFFALTYIRAGTELTWNYNYDVGSVPGKVLYCHCSSQECRGRLL